MITRRYIVRVVGWGYANVEDTAGYTPLYSLKDRGEGTLKVHLHNATVFTTKPDAVQVSKLLVEKHSVDTAAIEILLVTEDNDNVSE